MLEYVGIPEIWVCLKMVSTPKPNGFADHYPYEKWLFHWEYTQHFQTNPYVDVPLPLSRMLLVREIVPSHKKLFSHKKQQLQAEKRASVSSFRHFQPSLLHLQSNLLPPSSHTRKLMVLYVATNTPSRRQHCPTSMMGSTAKTCWKTVTSLDHVPLLLRTTRTQAKHTLLMDEHP